MKKLLLITSDNNLSEKIKSDIKAANIDICDTVPNTISDYDLVALTNPVNTELRGYNIIRLHESLLPAFNTQTPVQDAYMAGVKVTGITVHRVENDNMTGKILAQYPVIIDNYTHFDQLENEIKELGYKIYPLIIKSLLEDKVFDIVDFLSEHHGCGSCGSCGGCRH